MTEAEGAALFRTLTNEANTTVLPDEAASAGGQGVYTYLQRGLEEFSRQVGGYYINDGTVDLQPGDDILGEVALPTDFTDVLWVRHNGRYLKRSTQEEWLSSKVRWTDISVDGTPTEYAISGAKIIFNPFPDQEAVTADDTPDVRYIAAPPAFSSSAFDQIAEQDHALPVYYAAALFIQLHNDVPEMQARAERLLALFFKGCEGARPFYERKRMPGRRTP